MADSTVQYVVIGDSDTEPSGIVNEAQILDSSIVDALTKQREIATESGPQRLEIVRQEPGGGTSTTIVLIEDQAGKSGSNIPLQHQDCAEVGVSSTQGRSLPGGQRIIRPYTTDSGATNPAEYFVVEEDGLGPNFILVEGGLSEEGDPREDQQPTIENSSPPTEKLSLKRKLKIERKLRNLDASFRRKQQDIAMVIEDHRIELNTLMRQNNFLQSQVNEKNLQLQRVLMEIEELDYLIAEAERN